MCNMGNKSIAIVCKPGCDAMNFGVNLIFLIKPFSLHDQKVVTKTKIYWKRKENLSWNKKHSHHFQKAFNQANATNFFRRWESNFNLQKKKQKREKGYEEKQANKQTNKQTDFLQIGNHCCKISKKNNLKESNKKEMMIKGGSIKHRVRE